MSASHPHTPAPHARADVPTMSLLRLAAMQRLTGVAVLVAALWLAVAAAMA